jgi:hypothetical protein
MKFLAWNDDFTNLTLTLRGMMNCQEQITSSSLSTQPISSTSLSTTTITPVSTTTNFPTESTTSPFTTTITPVEVPQCYSYIPLGIDVSNDIDNDTYGKEIQFIISGVSQLYNPSIYSMYYAYGFGDGQADPTVYFLSSPVSGLIYMVKNVLQHTTYSPSFLE